MGCNNPPTPQPAISAEHQGQHANCRACGTNARARGENPRGALPPEPPESVQTLDAMSVEWERNALRMAGKACKRCDGALWLNAERGPDGRCVPVLPCPNCNDEARGA